MSNQSTDPYYDRNQLALAFAAFARREGWNVGMGEDPDEPDWPVLYVDTPHGQVSWHLPADEIPDTLPTYERPWDGHDLQEKRRRIDLTVTQLTHDKS